MSGRGRDRRRHQRLRHGRRQGRHPLGRPLQHAGHARGLLPGGRPRRPRRPARRVRAPVRLRRPHPPGTLHRERVPPRRRWSTGSTTSSAQLDADPIELTQAEIREAAGIELNESAVGTALKILEGAGAIEKFLPRENMAIVRINAEPDEPASLVDRLSPQAHVQRIVLLGLEGLVNRRYGEPVYFHPDDFAAALGLDRPALTRALRALTAELPIDYVPPFRGNAIRVIDRDAAAARPRDRLRHAREAQAARVRQARPDDQVCPGPPVPPLVPPRLLRRLAGGRASTAAVATTAARRPRPGGPARAARSTRPPGAR